MEREKIKSKLKEIIAIGLGQNMAAVVENCSDDANLVTDLGLNSVGILYVVIGIEEIFNVTFENVSFNEFKTVGDVINYIEKKLK